MSAAIPLGEVREKKEDPELKLMQETVYGTFVTVSSDCHLIVSSYSCTSDSFASEPLCVLLSAIDCFSSDDRFRGIVV